MNNSGNMLEEYNYDPCLPVRSKAKEGGRRRNPTNWSYSGVSLPTYTNRGFTGHEHLDMFELIHMLSEAKSREQSEARNGRIYDPEIARFLSPDPVIQDPYSIFSYNRYSYCLNNPLKYTDPSGYKEAEIEPELIWTNPGWLKYADPEHVNNYYDYLESLGGGGGGGGGGPSSAINTLLNSTYGGHWSQETGITMFQSDAEAFFAGAIYNWTFNSWGSSPEMATSFIDACSRYSKIKFLQNLTASLSGGGTLENSTPWMDIAINEIGQTEKIADPSYPTKQIINPRVQNYFTDGGFAGNPDDVSWCAIFVNYCLQNAGIRGTGSPAASSFLNWGQGIDGAYFGAIAVYDGHVGFVVCTKGDAIYLLGGNQSNRVYVSHYTTWSKGNVKSFRYPSMYRPSPFEW